MPTGLGFIVTLLASDCHIGRWVAWDGMDWDRENLLSTIPQTLIQNGRECAPLREGDESRPHGYELMKTSPAKVVAYRTRLSRFEGGALDTREERGGKGISAECQQPLIRAQLSRRNS